MTQPQWLWWRHIFHLPWRGAETVRRFSCFIQRQRFLYLDIFLLVCLVGFGLFSWLFLLLFALICMSNMDQCNKSYLASWPSGFCGKIFNVGHCTLKFSTSFFFVSAKLLGTIDFYHFILLSLTFTLAASHKISAKQNLVASVSHILPNDQDEIWCGLEAIQVKHPDTRFKRDLMKQG